MYFAFLMGNNKKLKTSSLTAFIRNGKSASQPHSKFSWSLLWILSNEWISRRKLWLATMITGASRLFPQSARHGQSSVMFSSSLTNSAQEPPDVIFLLTPEGNFKEEKSSKTRTRSLWNVTFSSRKLIPIPNTKNTEFDSVLEKHSAMPLSRLKLPWLKKKIRKYGNTTNYQVWGTAIEVVVEPTQHENCSWIQQKNKQYVTHLLKSVLSWEK